MSVVPPTDRPYGEWLQAEMQSLSPDAVEVLRMGVSKFLRGVEEHGPMDLDNSTILQLLDAEIEEDIDKLFYKLMQRVKIRRLLARGDV